MKHRNSPLASSRFTAHQNDALELLRRLAADIEKFQQEFNDGGRTDWGFVGSMAHVTELLQEAHNHLTSDEE